MFKWKLGDANLMHRSH